MPTIITIDSSAFIIIPITGSNVMEVARKSSGLYVGLVRLVGGRARANGVDGWETFPSLAEAVAAVVRRSGDRW